MHPAYVEDRAAHELQSKLAQPSNGPLIHYVEQGEPGGEPVIFIHGWPDSWFSFSTVMRQLPTSVRAFALDLRGFGRSGRPPAPYTVDQFAADIAGFIDLIGCGPATLVGHSMGSFVARRVAERYPGHVGRLMLIGSGMTALNDVTRDIVEISAGLSDPISRTFVREFQASTIHAPVSDLFFEGLIAESLKAPARVWQEALNGLLAFDDTADLRRINVPTLIVWGEHDGLFTSINEQVRLASAIPGARLTIYADAGHSPNWEWPARIANDLTTFIRATATPHSAARHAEDA